jgi:hypothetical protein
MLYKQHADEAQHAFSSETEPVLLHALPALERLHKTWSSIAGKSKYSRYHAALNAALEKINTYYNKTSSVNAYNMAMSEFLYKPYTMCYRCSHAVLDPGLKTQYFQKNWGKELETAARDVAEELVSIIVILDAHLLTTSDQFEQRWHELNPSTPTSTTSRVRSIQPSASRSLDIDNSSDDENTAVPSPPPPTAANKPWLKEFKRYLDGSDELDNGQSVVTWWGVRVF